MPIHHGILFALCCTDNVISIRGRKRAPRSVCVMMRRLTSGKYVLSSRKADPKTGRSKSWGTFDTRKEAEDQERAIEILETQRMIAREGIYSSVQRVVRCSPSQGGKTG